MTLTPQWLDELRARTVLSTLIGKSIKVTRAGREYKACCPFHNEKTPSFTINDDKGFYHCLAGETLVMTRQGRRAIADLNGQTAEILTRGGQWLSSPVKSYGVQRLWRIGLTRNRVRKEIFATSGHRWFVRGRKSEVTTSDIRPGQRLQSVVPAPRSDWTLDPEGIRHGIVFGDGTMEQGVYGTVNLHGEKDVELRQWFPGQQHHIHERTGGHLYLRVYGGRAFEGMKALPPPGASDAYLLGFLAGYLAADGHVAKDGTVMLNSADADTLEAIRDISTGLGIVTYGRTTLMRRGYGDTPSPLHRIHFVPNSLAEPLFLLSIARRRFVENSKRYARLGWTITSVEQTDRHEEVYCAEVAGEHAFALDDNILTGNCFGCGAHGDAIRWMTEQRGLPFMDAVKELAATAGLDVPAADPRAAARAEAAVSLRDVTEASANWFRERLADSEGADARAYLQKRGLSAATIATFALGYAPDARGRLREVLGKFGDELAVEAGMLIQPSDDAPNDSRAGLPAGKAKQKREPYDRFRGRLMIPIRDARGRTIAFGGRILGTGEPKYLNSPDTPLFDKGRILYNLDRAAPAARKTDRLIIVEGYMDVIALAQAGIEEAVAPLGTALTEAQIELAWRQVPVPILAFDGDAAGQRAALRAATRALPLLRPGHSLSFLTLPAGQDPDDIVSKGGAAAFNALAAAPAPLVDLLWRTAFEGRADETPEARANVRKQLFDWADSIADRDVAAHYRQAFKDRIDEAFFAPRPRPQREFTPGQRGPRGPNTRFAPPERAPTASLRGIGPAIDARLADAVIAGLLRYPGKLSAHAEALAALPIEDPETSRLLATLTDIAFDRQETLDSEGLMTILADMAVYNKAQQLLRADAIQFSFTRGHDFPDDEDGLRRRAAAEQRAVRDLDEAISAVIAWPEVERELAAATEAMRHRLDAASFDNQQRLLRSKAELAERLAGLGETSRL